MRSSAELSGSTFKGAAQAPRNLKENHKKNLILDFLLDFQLGFRAKRSKTRASLKRACRAYVNWRF